MRTLVIAVTALAASAGTSFAQDGAAGEQVFKRLCSPCHEIGPDAKIKLGPPLNGIDGRKSGPLDGFNYSPANKSSGITWSEEIFPNRSRSAWQLQRLVYGLLKPFSIRHKIISAVLYGLVRNGAQAARPSCRTDSSLSARLPLLLEPACARFEGRRTRDHDLAARVPRSDSARRPAGAFVGRRARRAVRATMCRNRSRE